jgi:cell division protein FtsN
MAKTIRDITKKSNQKHIKRNVRKNSTQKAAQPFGVWAFSTFLLVALAAGFVYIFMQDKIGRSKVTHKLVTIEQSNKIIKEVNAPAKIDKPRFEFYNILPNTSLTVEQPLNVPKRDKHHYDVQVASTKIKKDAEHLRARLILHGLDSHIVRVKTTKNIWYRISLGPYDTRTDAETVLKKLRQHDIDGLIHRLD